MANSHITRLLDNRDLRAPFSRILLDRLAQWVPSVLLVPMVQMAPLDPGVRPATTTSHLPHPTPSSSLRPRPPPSLVLSSSTTTLHRPSILHRHRYTVTHCSILQHAATRYNTHIHSLRVSWGPCSDSIKFRGFIYMYIYTHMCLCTYTHINTYIYIYMSYIYTYRYIYGNLLRRDVYV